MFLHLFSSPPAVCIFKAASVLHSSVHQETCIFCRTKPCCNMWKALETWVLIRNQCRFCSLPSSYSLVAKFIIFSLSKCQIFIEVEYVSNSLTLFSLNRTSLSKPETYLRGHRVILGPPRGICGSNRSSGLKFEGR